MENNLNKVVKKLKSIFPEIDKLNVEEILSSYESEIEYFIKNKKPQVIDFAIKVNNFPPIETNSKKIILPQNKQTEEIITLVFDIRSSSEILKNISLNKFYDFVYNFVAQAKSILFSEKYRGIYDKFTGDGFIVHFSKKISGSKFIQNALSYSERIIYESDTILKKVFEEVQINYSHKIGISAGIDIGKIMWFRNGSELSVIGTSVVYATRLCSCADKKEILVNNIVYNRAKKYFNFKEKKIKPKGFEENFTVYKLLKF